MSRACTCGCSTGRPRDRSDIVDWNSDRAPNFTIRQDSGTWNALGAVRIDMPNAYSVYMHDTNHKEFFSADYRFQSSGCTRVEDPRALAAWLLADTGLEPRQIDAGIAKGERTTSACHKVPVAWVYLTGWVTRDDTIHFRDDIYGHDDKPALMADARPQVASAARASGLCCNQRTRGHPPQTGVLPRQPVGQTGSLNADIGDRSCRCDWEAYRRVSIAMEGGASWLMNIGWSVCDLNCHPLSGSSTQSFNRSAISIGGLDCGAGGRTTAP